MYNGHKKEYNKSKQIEATINTYIKFCHKLMKRLSNKSNMRFCFMGIDQSMAGTGSGCYLLLLELILSKSFCASLR